MANRNLIAAKKAKNDEFYTQLSDIENELRHYREVFRGKTVLCNCDDPRVSNFTRYFLLNFQHLGLKRLISTCYKNNEPDLFSEGEGEHACYLDYSGEVEVRSVDDIAKLEFRPLRGDGDFRSEECIEFLKQAEIVCTNPPFSLFREYVAQLMEYGKQFIIVGPQNAITYKEVFPLIKDNKLWLGYGFNAGNAFFGIPDDARTLYSENVYNPKTGLVKFRNCHWFTNIDIPKRHEELILCKSYYKKPEQYPKYDNYDAINVDKVADIPYDYPGALGVPLTFIDKYNTEQFEIMGNEEMLGISKGRGYVNGKRMYSRIFIRIRRKAE